MAIKELNHEESISALRKTLERAELMSQSLTDDELKVNPSAATGACCLYTYGVSSCTGGITQTACAKSAANTGSMFHFTEGKSCSQVKCP